MTEFELKPWHTFVIAEAGINHNGSLETAKQLVDAAKDADCDCVKFQVKTPILTLPQALWNVERDTPWGRMTYLAYRERIELSPADLAELVRYCREKDIIFAASPWDCKSADTLFELGSAFIKVASASVTNLDLLKHIAKMGKPVVMSTGMSDGVMVKDAVKILYPNVPSLSLLACTSKYPAPIDQLHLSRMDTLRKEFPGCHVGYSGHEVGLWTTLCAAAMGAEIVERHITLDRSMVGSDHAASVEPQGMKVLVREIRNLEMARGFGLLGVLDCEQADVKRLRG